MHIIVAQYEIIEQDKGLEGMFKHIEKCGRTCYRSEDKITDDSYQKFDAKIIGSAPCHGHTECDSIIMDEGQILAVPGLEANHVDASLFHEAAIGKIAGEQLIKLMTLGLTEAEAEEQIINGFLR